MSRTRGENAGWRRVLRTLGIDVRPGEGAVAGLLFLCFFLLITFQYTTKSVRQSTFIDQLGATYLPLAYLAVALLSLPFLWIYSRVADRASSHRLIASTSVVISASLVVCWYLFGLSADWLPFVFYVWISIVYVMNVSQFWSFSNHVLDARQAKRLFGFIGAGGLLGGVAGGQVARLVSSHVDTRSTFLVAAVLLLLMAILILVIHALHPEKPPGPGGRPSALEKLERARGGLNTIRRSRQLQSIAAVMVLTVMVAQFVDLQFNWAAEHWTRATGLDQRTAFFGNFFSIMGISAFLFQLTFTARIHRQLGVGFAMRVLPITMGLGTGAMFLTAALFPAGLISAAYLLKIGENGLRYSLDQVTRELLFLPVPPRARLKAKAYIDVFIQRGAKGLAGLILLLVTFGWLTELQTGWISLGLIGLWLVVAGWAFREYVRSFRQSLRQRTMGPAAAITLSDVTTLELVVQSLGSPDARQVMHGLELLTIHGRGALVPPLLLYHEDAEVRRATLGILAAEGRRDALPLIERSLGDDDSEVRAEAVRALAELRGEDAAVTMLPRLRDPDPGVRASAVACLANHGDAELEKRASAVLAGMLCDADPQERSEAAKAIGSIREPRFDTALVDLLYDEDPRVARGAIRAVRHRVARDGFNPIYVPKLISLLEQRRLKHDAREALVAFGDPVVPSLAYFLADRRESIWVRRALPKTLARLDHPEATRRLLETLTGEDDPFVRRKAIEALDPRKIEEGGATAGACIESAIRDEAGRHLRCLAILAGVGLEPVLRLDGALPRWRDPDPEPDLLLQLLVERTEEHFHNLFALLALLHERRHVWAAHRSLAGGSAEGRAHALEYLDNTLTGNVRRLVFAVINDEPLHEKLRRAERMFGIEVRSRVDTLRELLDGGKDGNSAAVSLAVAALYQVYSARSTELYTAVEELLGVGDPFLAETASWVARRLGLHAAADEDSL